MQDQTFHIKKVLKQCCSPSAVEGLRFFILLACLLSAIFGYIGNQFSVSPETMARMITVLRHHHLAILPFADRLTYFFTIILVTFVCLPLTAGIILISVKKQRGESFFMADLFMGYKKLPEFFLLALIDTIFCCTCYFTPFNLIGLCPHSYGLFYLLILFSLLLRVIFWAFFFIIPVSMIDTNRSFKSAVKLSFHLMSHSWNALKFVVCIIAVSLVFFMLAAAIVVSGPLLSALVPHSLVHFVHAFIVLLLMGAFVFFIPMAFQAFAAIYRTLTLRKVTI